MAADRLGGLARRWLRAKGTATTTASHQQRGAAEYEADQTARQLQQEAIGEAVLGAVPGLRRFRDHQEQAQREHAAAVARHEHERLAALPVAGFQLRLTGAASGTWVGTVPALVEVVEPDGDASGDPSARMPALVVELGPLSAPAAPPGADLVGGWRFEVRGYHGPGAYDLAASGMERRAADAEPDYIEWELRFGDDGERFYFQPDLGPSAVLVGTDRIDVTMWLTGASGQVQAAAVIDVAVPPTG